MIKRMRTLFLGLLLLALAPELLSAADSLQVANVRFEAVADRVIITYDLLEPTDPVFLKQGNREYKITLVLRREKDGSFGYYPRNVTGDAGAGIREGSNKQIVWHIAKEFPAGLEGDDFFFVVNVEPITVQRKTPWLWYGAGAAVLGGTLAAILLLRGEGSSPPESRFPDPPGRP